MLHTQSYRIDKALHSLTGVAIGDAFGESFFGDTNHIQQAIHERKIPPTDWQFTDDTVMSLAVFEQLEKNGEIQQDKLVYQFCHNHDIDPNRGYGATVRRVLREIQEGNDWRQVSQNAFDGQGSMGNGAAMRVCPIGAFFFDDLEKVKQEAIKSAIVTHANQEAIAGAIAVATAAAIATGIGETKDTILPADWIEKIAMQLPDCDTRSKILLSKTVSIDYHIETIRKMLGNGNNMTAQDTVPFAIWCAVHYSQNFENALWKAVSILGDRDTICAIVGGITIMSADITSVPGEWLQSVEKPEQSIFRTSRI